MASDMWSSMLTDDPSCPSNNLTVTDAHCGNNATCPFCYDSAWAISAYCFAASFVFGFSQILTRHLMTNKRSTKVMMSKSSTYSVKRGRTRLIPEMLTVSFLFRTVWCVMKGAPGEPWACYEKGTISFPYESDYGCWKYALREMFNRFATLMSFSAFTILIIFWAGTAAITERKSKDVHMTSRLDEYEPGGQKPTKAKYTCCQGIYVSLNVWLYLVLIGITIVNFIPNNLNDNCIPNDINEDDSCGYSIYDPSQSSNYACWCEVVNYTTQHHSNETEDIDRQYACLVNRTWESKSLFGTKNLTYTWRDSTPWANLKEGTILFTNSLYMLLVIGLTVFGSRVVKALDAVHTDRGGRKTTTDGSSLTGLDDNGDGRVEEKVRKRACGMHAMKVKMLLMIVSCTLCFCTRFVLFVWPYVVPEKSKFHTFKGLACTVLRPYFQYVVVELIPALLLLIVMHPVANRRVRPKFFSGKQPLVPNDAEALVVQGGRATTYGVEFIAANDPEHRI